jgi:colanic acid biosynthesis glycosyl transferase WcaI
MNRLIFINRYFFPDYSATSQILSDLAFHLADLGKEVHVITGHQLYDDPSAHLPSEQTIRNVNIHRVAATRFGRANLLGRGTDYLSFYASTWRAVMRTAQNCDILIAKTDPPLISVPVLMAARRRGAKLVNWLQDLYPEIAIELKVPGIRGSVAKALLRMRNASLNAAVANVVVGERMAQRLAACGIPADRVHVIQNWCDDEQIRPLAGANNPLRREWGLGDKFVIGYSGNLGRTHEFSTVLEAAERLRAKRHIIFLFIGGGHLLDSLVAAVKARGLASMFCFIPYQRKDLLRYSLNVANVHWLSLKPEIEGLLVPSKFYGIAASGRPMIAITAMDGEIGRLVRHYQCGFTVEPGNVSGLVKAIELFSDQAGLADAMGRRAREMLETQFSRRQALGRWSDLIESIEQTAVDRYNTTPAN